MYTLKLRHVIFLVAIAVCAFTSATLPVAAQTVRKSITALSPSELMSLRRGVAVMKSWNTATRKSANFRRSWIFWANMHGHFGDDCDGPITGTGMTGVKLWKASNPSETSTWCTCEHHTLSFLTWHRMYLYYFEKVLQSAANDPTLTLPYWDWATDNRLPAALRDKTYVNEAGKTVPNPLRVEQRAAALNKGTASLAASVTSAANAMNATTYSGFSSRLEAAPHGSVHCAVTAGGCPNGYMGSVASAALDPIFYFHHVNIDRLYECWLQAAPDGRLPTDPSLIGRQYTFPDGAGLIVTRTVSDMLTTSQLGYGYTSGAGCPPPAYPAGPVAEAVTAPAAAPAAAPMSATMQMADDTPAAAGQGETELKRGNTEVPIGIKRLAARGVAPGRATTGSKTAQVSSATVTIDGFTASTVPGVLYTVYLADDRGRRASIGVISFFGFNSMRHMKGHGAPGQQFQFDATRAVNTLGLASSTNPKVIFEPTTGLTNSTPVEAVQSIPKNARVAYRSATLTVQN